MSKFWEKVSEGVVPSERDWEEHLREAHRLSPGMTPKAFDELMTSSGLNSYELLVESIPREVKNPAILDLACGDGLLLKLLRERFRDAALTGVDMSEHELAAAKMRTANLSIALEKGRAQSLPFPSKSFDVVVCHHAIMLMYPLEPVLQEVYRVLKAGGVFMALTSLPQKTRGIYKQVQGILQSFTREKYPAISKVTTGDVRVYDPPSFAKLCETSGTFKSVSVVEHETKRPMTKEALWALVRDMYLVIVLPEAEKAALRTELDQYAESHRGTDMIFPIQIITAGTTRK
jgi:SAM-dependent methyltransferase